MKKVSIIAGSRGSVMEVTFWVMLIFFFFFQNADHEKSEYYSRQQGKRHGSKILGDVNIFFSFSKMLIMKKVSIIAGSRGSVMEVTFWVMLIFFFFFQNADHEKSEYYSRQQGKRHGSKILGDVNIFFSFSEMLIMKKVSIMAGSRGSVMEVKFWVMLIFFFFFQNADHEKMSIIAGSRGSVM